MREITIPSEIEFQFPIQINSWRDSVSRVSLVRVESCGDVVFIAEDQIGPLLDAIREKAAEAWPGKAL